MIQLISLLVCLVCANAVYALDDATKLAKKAQNPVEDMVSVPLNSTFNFGFGDHGNTQYILNAKPVIPIHVTERWNLISRTIVPVLRQPSLLPSRGYLTGLGDINPSAYLTPAKNFPIIWGVGPSVMLPTATRHDLGAGKYSIGPSLVVLTMPKEWVLGFLAYNIWSVGGQSSRPNVNSFELQYFVNYNMPHGWYVTTQPIITADWTATSTNRWVVPFGIGFGHVFSIAKQAINMSLQGYANAVTASYGPNWQAQLDISLLYPEPT